MHDEREQLDRLKKWVTSHGLSVFLGLALGLGGLFGWRAWQESRVADYTRISTSVFMLGRALRNQDNPRITSPELSRKRARDYARELEVEGLRDGIYADITRLLRARVEIEQGSIQAAVRLLKEIVDQGEDSVFAPSAGAMLARVYIEMSQYDEALAAVDALPEAYAATKAELRGDIHYYRGEPELARRAYEDALGLAESQADAHILRLKTEGVLMRVDDLAGESS